MKFPVAIEARFAWDVIAENLKSVKRRKQDPQIPCGSLDDYVDNA
jgi:hypothetical protein